MSEAYVMKDLGYARTPTQATMEVTMPNGTLWSIPVQAVTDSPFEIYDWAGNNMNWSDVAKYAVQMPTPQVACDFGDGWANGEKQIKGEI